MKPIAIAKAGIIFTFFCFLLNGGTGFADTIKIGVAGVHSGDLASYGIPSVRAVELAAADINRRGGIRARLMVAFIIEKPGLQRVAILHDKGDYGKG